MVPKRCGWTNSKSQEGWQEEQSVTTPPFSLLLLRLWTSLLAHTLLQTETRDPFFPFAHATAILRLVKCHLRHCQQAHTLSKSFNRKSHSGIGITRSACLCRSTVCVLHAEKDRSSKHKKACIVQIKARRAHSPRKVWVCARPDRLEFHQTLQQREREAVKSLITPRSSLQLTTL